MAYGPHYGRAVPARSAQGNLSDEKRADRGFAQGVDEIFLEARDATVHILRGFGAQIAGEPFTFYRGRVTPILLKRTDFVRNTRK